MAKPELETSVEGDQIIDESTLTDLVLLNPISITEDAYYHLQVNIVVKTIVKESGTRLELVAKRNQEAAINKCTHIVSRHTCKKSIDEIKEEYIYGDISVGEFERRLDECIHFNQFGEEVEMNLTVSKMLYLDEDDEINLSIRSDKESVVVKDESQILLYEV